MIQIVSVGKCFVKNLNSAALATTNKNHLITKNFQKQKTTAAAAEKKTQNKNSQKNPQHKTKTRNN